MNIILNAIPYKPIHSIQKFHMANALCVKPISEVIHKMMSSQTIVSIAQIDEDMIPVIHTISQTATMEYSSHIAIIDWISIIINHVCHL